MKFMPSDKACIFLLGRRPHGVQCQSLCGSEVTRKIRQLEVEGSHVSQCPISGDANGKCDIMLFATMYCNDCRVLWL